MIIVTQVPSWRRITLWLCSYPWNADLQPSADTSTAFQSDSVYLRKCWPSGRLTSATSRRCSQLSNCAVHKCAIGSSPTLFVDFDLGCWLQLVSPRLYSVSSGVGITGCRSPGTAGKHCSLLSLRPTSIYLYFLLYFYSLRFERKSFLIWYNIIIIRSEKYEYLIECAAKVMSQVKPAFLSGENPSRWCLAAVGSYDLEFLHTLPSLNTRKYSSMSYRIFCIL